MNQSKDRHSPRSLKILRKQILAYLEKLRDKDGPFGAFRIRFRERCDLYSSVDAALMRAIMGEDLKKTLSDEERKSWTTHINSFVENDFGRPTDGSYFDRMGHNRFHANGQVIKALGLLGGRQIHPFRLYESFDTTEKLATFLDALDWSNIWPVSHTIWGGLFPFARSARCPADWETTLLDWLDREADPDTGWWRKGVRHQDRNQGLGGAAHILPLYQHLGRALPHPEKLIDSILNLQLPNGRWLETKDPYPMSYLELDALYGLKFAGKFAAGHRSTEITQALIRYGVWVNAYLHSDLETSLFARHPHHILAGVGCLGLLQQHLPELWTDEVTWSDIFSDPRFMMTREVEAVAP